MGAFTSRLHGSGSKLSGPGRLPLLLLLPALALACELNPTLGGVPAGEAWVLDEGDQGVYLTAAPEGCSEAGELVVLVDDPAGITACTVFLTGTACDLLDDGEVTVTFAWVSDVTEAAQTATVSVRNVAPRLVDPWVVTADGEPVEVDLDVEDVPADTVRIELLDGPDGLTVGADGHLSWPEGRGSESAWVLLSDEDGGERHEELLLRIGDTPYACSHAGPSPSWLLLPLLLLRRRSP